ncbi:MAG TPA: hypothetical protein VE958_11540 [Bryobacteraceae bacterium]|nr:hypothetical protein [Bryobacteraceae bacterium]
MALTTAFTNPIGGHPALRAPGCIFVNVLTGGATYATATGGVAVDLATILAAASTNGIAVADIIIIDGASTDGYRAVFAFASGTTYNMRLYTSGASEIADGAVTKTVNAKIWLAGGSLS